MKKLFLLHLILFSSTCCFAQNEKPKDPFLDSLEIKEGVKLKIEDQPIFPGGEEAMYKYISENLKYPKSARRNNITGMVYLRFVVGRDGYIRDVKTLKGIKECPECEEEAIRVFNNMPRWEPGKQQGHKVPVSYNIPLSFTLRNKE